MLLSCIPTFALIFAVGSNQFSNVSSEYFSDFIKRCIRVLNGVVKQRRAYGIGIESKLGNDTGNRYGMAYIRLWCC